VADVLVVEDEESLLQTLRYNLSRAGHAVRLCTDGSVGLEMALENPPDLLVLDLMLPGRPGLEILGRLHSEKPSLPVIVLTARSEVGDRVAGLDAGAVDYLVKPFSLAELLARVRAHLRVSARSHPSALKGADIELDLITRRVRRGGRTIPMTTTSRKRSPFQTCSRRTPSRSKPSRR